MLRCSRSTCGAFWLSPQPTPKKLAIAYSSYYTHTATVVPTSHKNWLRKSLKRLAGIEHRKSRIQRMFLGDVKPGRLLDVGCGNGDRLVMFRKLGWQVEGQEVDPSAHAVAVSRGLCVHLGDLSELALEPESFDAITMNHVIEHVADAAELLNECRRLLAPDGRLIITTPNGSGLGHRVFGARWRGLEPPRHLMVHTQNSLRVLCKQSGYTAIDTRTETANAHYFFAESILTNRKFSQGWARRLVHITSWALHIVAIGLNCISRSLGEEVVVIARRYAMPL